LVILVNPNLKLNQWHTDVIRATGEALRAIPLPDGRVVNSSGNYVIYTDMLDSVARDAAEPAAKEFSRALAESRIGSDISDALEHVAIRMDSENMRWAVMAIRIQREVGGNLADTLRTTAATLREREMLKRHVRALSAEGRLSAYILIALPIGVLLFSMWSNYEYVSLLWTTTVGLVMCVMGVLAMMFGIWWMKKTVTIEV
jgi:tight adherence protein B